MLTNKLLILVDDYPYLGNSRRGGRRLHSVPHEVLLAPKMGLRLLVLQDEVNTVVEITTWGKTHPETVFTNLG